MWSKTLKLADMSLYDMRKTNVSCWFFNHLYFSLALYG